MSESGYVNHLQALSRAFELADELRDIIKVVRAEAGRDDLIDAIRQAQGPLSYLRDELAASRLSREGSRLCWAADEINQDSPQTAPTNEQEYLFTFEEDLRSTLGIERDALDLDFQTLAKSFDESWDDESFLARSGNLRTSAARRAAKLIAKHYASLKK